MSTLIKFGTSTPGVLSLCSIFRGRGNYKLLFATSWYYFCRGLGIDVKVQSTLSLYLKTKHIS